MRHILRSRIIAIATCGAVTAAWSAPAPPAPRATSAARMFPWVVEPERQGALCASLLDPTELGRASTGVLVYLDYGSGPTAIPSASVPDLARRLAAPRSGTPQVRALATSPSRVTLEARDVGGSDGGGVRCTYDFLANAWHMVAVAIMTPANRPQQPIGARR